jgi:protein-S-isoprenylcysteine O-methyltransferase Ste14
LNSEPHNLGYRLAEVQQFAKIFMTIDKNFEKDTPGVNLMPPTVFYVCLACGGLLEFVFPHNFPFLAAPLRIALGLVVGIAGFIFMLVAHETFKRSGTAVPTNQSATTFVAKGAYRLSRNPMYVGGSAFFLGIGLVAGSLWIFAFYIPLATYLAMYVVPREEAYMEREFGNDYRLYRSKVRRWI